VNTLLLVDREAVLNIISLELVKKLRIQELREAYCKYITANRDKSKVVEIDKNIFIKFLV
jgi:hypothetical protein